MFCYAFFFYLGQLYDLEIGPVCLFAGFFSRNLVLSANSIILSIDFLRFDVNNSFIFIVFEEYMYSYFAEVFAFI